MKKAPLYLILAAASFAFAQDDETVSSESIIDSLIGDETTRAILVRQRQSPAGMSVDLTIEFEFDSSELTSDATDQLIQLHKALDHEKLQPYAFEIVGHTDGKGDAEYNERLSLARAKSVRDFLLEQGVAPDRLVIDGKGEYEMLYPHLPDDHRNRRVEITNLGETRTNQ